jgi:hypothetical protein
MSTGSAPFEGLSNALEAQKGLSQVGLSAKGRPRQIERAAGNPGFPKSPAAQTTSKWSRYERASYFFLPPVVAPSRFISLSWSAIALAR